ncbi:MAG: hypothetical protein KatS3mg057_0298 [Herpetosiphonaceae bacterium]|nr:MAG: hypothetical protein KatS3mg057_0298 [Herpetosiphonaceae bacterium]
MPIRIMVVNDQQEMLDLFREILTDEGYEFVGFSYAIHDMDEIERIKPDLIIVDCMFGEEKPGWQMLQKLKLRRSTATIPVVLCTHSIRAVREIEGYLKAKGITVIFKPFEINDLLSAIRAALKHIQPSQSPNENQVVNTDQ